MPLSARRLLERLVPAGAALVALGLYLADGLAFHPGIASASCPTGELRLDHWDGAWYQYIAEHGYATIPGSDQQAASFFPLFPWLAAAIHWALPFMSLTAAGITVNLLAAAGALTITDRIVAGWPLWQRIVLCAVLVTLPGAFFYAAFYSEALFLLAVAVVTWAIATPGRLAWAPAGIAVASADRVIGLALLAALVIALWLSRAETSPRRALGLVAASLSGVVAVAVFSATSAHNPVAFVSARAGWRGVSGVGYVPYTVGHGLGATATLVREEASGSAISADGDPAILGAVLPWTLGLYLDLLVLPLALAAWRFRREIGIVAVVLVSATLLAGPPISQARFTLVLLPVWIGAVSLARGRPILWGVAGVAIVGGLAVNLHLMAQFANCGWAG